ncbi:MAG TPA: hypothetical protein VFB73_13625 [Chloroflexota bacterium]|nr:hypothetical protein [Chloroflexota bacterium]HZU07000.1 hypothetical protein [Chloroflexota bacterium]
MAERTEDVAPAERVGEIIEATSHAFVAQSVRLHQAPPFGSLVRVPVADTDLYAVVAETRTASLEASGRPIARGYADIVDAAIYRENPDLEHVLRTEFRALLVGFRAGSTVFQHLPALPPPLHYSVYTCRPSEVVAFTARLDYLRTLLAGPAALADELVAASTRLAAAARGHEQGEAFLLQVGRALALLLRDDYDRLTAILRRLRPEEPWR